MTIIRSVRWSRESWRNSLMVSAIRRLMAALPQPRCWRDERDERVLERRLGGATVPERCERAADRDRAAPSCATARSATPKRYASSTPARGRDRRSAPRTGRRRGSTSSMRPASAFLISAGVPSATSLPSRISDQAAALLGLVHVVRGDEHGHAALAASSSIRSQNCAPALAGRRRPSARRGTAARARAAAPPRARRAAAGRSRASPRSAVQRAARS